MNYRKAVNTKQKIEATFSNLKKAAKDNVEKAKEFAGNTTEEFKNNVKTTAQDFKKNIENTIKDKLAVEFRRNYPSYAISYIDALLVKVFSEGGTDVVISIDEPETLTISELLDEIGDGMVTSAVLDLYKTQSMIQGLFDFLVTYFENEPQLKVSKTNTSFTINLVEEVVEEDTQTEETETINIDETKTEE